MASKSKKGSFFKSGKELKDTAGKTAIGILERGGGALAAGATANLVATKLPKMPPKAIGPILLGVGLLGEMLVKEEHTNRIAQGITVYGIQSTLANTVMPEQKQWVGFGDLEEGEEGMSGEEDEEDEDGNLRGWQEAYGRSAINGTPGIFNDDVPMQGTDDEEGSLGNPVFQDTVDPDNLAGE